MKKVKRKTTKNNKTTKQIKKERKNQSLREPSNLTYWKFVIQNQKELQQFLDKGTNRQKDSLKRVFNYIKKKDKEEFEKLGGKEWLKKLKE